GIDEIAVRDVVEFVVEVAMGMRGHAATHCVHVRFDWAGNILIQSMAVMSSHRIANLELFVIRKAHYLGYVMADFFLRFGGGVEHRFRPNVVRDLVPLAPVERGGSEQREHYDNNPAFHKYSRRASRFLAKR